MFACVSVCLCAGAWNEVVCKSTQLEALGFGGMGEMK